MHCQIDVHSKPGALSEYADIPEDRPQCAEDMYDELLLNEKKKKRKKKKFMSCLTMGNGLSRGSMDGCDFADFNYFTGMCGHKSQYTPLFDACSSS